MPPKQTCLVFPNCPQYLISDFLASDILKVLRECFTEMLCYTFRGHMGQWVSPTMHDTNLHAASLSLQKQSFVSSRQNICVVNKLQNQ